MLRAVSVLSVIVAAACAGSADSSADAAKGAATASGSVNDPAVRAAIDSMNRQFADAFKAGDAAKAASFYAEDATSMPPNSEPMSGRAGIEKGMAEAFKGMGKVSEFATTTKEFDLYGDHAIEISTYEMTLTPPGAKEAMKDHGSVMAYWRKQADGSWKVHRDIVTSANPMPGMGPPPAKK
jgi:uncharacterized protein (TIGR02246 family)